MGIFSLNAILNFTKTGNQNVATDNTNGNDHLQPAYVA